MTMFTPLYSFLRWCPGGLGLFLRQRFYPLILGACGRKILFGRFVNIKNPEKIHFADNVIINDNVTLDASGFSEKGPAIILGEKVFIGSGSSLHARNGKITILPDSSVGSFCSFKANGAITIGEHVLLAAFCQIGYCPGQYKDISQSKYASTKLNNEITIEPGCWLGVRCSILPGVSIGAGSIIGAHSIVQNSIDSNVIAVGIPAKIMRYRFSDKTKNES